MKCQSYRFIRGSDFLRIEAISPDKREAATEIDPPENETFRLNYENTYGVRSL